MANLKHSEITGAILRSFYTVYNTLGYGFLEKVYENALVLELRSAGFLVEQQRGISVLYRDTTVGEYFADLFIDACLVVEVKACKGLIDEHIAQLLGYLRSSRVEHGLLINFGSDKLQVKKFALSRE